MMGWEVCQAFEQILSSPTMAYDDYKEQVKNLILQNPDYAVWYSKTLEERLNVITHVLIEHAVIQLTGSKPKRGKGGDESIIAA